MGVNKFLITFNDLPPQKIHNADKIIIFTAY